MSCVKAPPSKLLRQALGFEKLGFLDQLFTSALGVCPRSWRARSGKGGDSDPWKKHESAQAMLPALSTKPKQAVRQVKGLTNDSIDAYANTPMGGGGVAGNTMTSYADNTEGSGTARASPPSTTKPAGGSGRNTARKSYGGDGEEPFTSGLLARVVRDRKASGDEELTLKAGDVVHVLSTKRTGYLRCEFGDDVGYVPSSYLEFFDENGNGGDAGTDRDNADESQRSEKRKKKKEKRQKEKKLVGGDDPEETVVTTARSPRKTNGDHREASHPAEEGNPGGDESSRKSKKKHKEPKKHRHHAKQDDDDDDALAAKRGGGDDTERRKGGKKHSSKKKRHHDSSESSESDEDSRHRKGRRHRSHRRRGRGHGSDSESSSSYYSSSDSGYRRSRRRHRHRKGSSEEDDYDTDKRKAKRHGRRRDHGGSGSEVDDNETPRSPRRNDKKRRDDAAADPLVTSPRKEKDTTTNGVEKGIAKLDVQTEKPSSRNSEVISSHTPDQDIKQTASTTTTEKSGGSSARTKGKDDEGRTESTVTAHKAKTNLGKQIGEKMRSLLGGGKKTERSHKSSSGILNACPGTTQGEEGWYEHGENERYYFVLLDGKWSLLYGPMTEDDFETYSNKVGALCDGLFATADLQRELTFSLSLVLLVGCGSKPHGRITAHLPTQSGVFPQPRAPGSKSVAKNHITAKRESVRSSSSVWTQ